MIPASYIRRNLPNIVVASITVTVLVAIMYAHVRSTTTISHLADAFLNSLHGPGFAFISVFVFSILRLYHRRPANYLHAGIITMAIGLFSEVAQIPGPRDASVSDLTLDAIGTVGGLGTFALFDREFRSRIPGWALVGLGVASNAALMLTFVPTAWYAYAAAAQYRALPTLLSFEDAWEKEIYRETWRIRPELIPAAPGWPEGSITIAYAKEAGQSGVLMSIEPYPDWSNYSYLSFAAASPNKKVQNITLIIRDVRIKGERRGNVYRQRLSIGPEPTRYVIPLKQIQNAMNRRPFDFTRVSAIAIIATPPRSGAALYFDDFRLE